MIVSRRILVRVAVAVVVLFLLAFVRGAVGEVALYVFLLGVLLLIVLGVVALVQSARSRRPPHYRGLGRKPPRVSLAVALIPTGSPIKLATLPQPSRCRSTSRPATDASPTKSARSSGS